MTFKSQLYIPLTYFQTFEKWQITEFFLSAVLAPMACVFGIVTNALVVYVVSHKSSKKELENNHYKFMRLNAVVNIVILLIEPLTIITECQGYIMGILCSPPRFVLFVQYFKIIVVEYSSNALRLLSNFSYVGFAINRLALVGKKHGKFVSKVSKWSVREFLNRVFLPSGLLSAIKIFHSFPNSYDPMYDYPFTSTDMYPRMTNSLLLAYLIFEFLFNFVNYFLFLVVNLIIDVVLVVRMKRTLNEKASKQILTTNKLKTEK